MTMLQHGLVPSTGGYQIERSLRFNSADSAYLSRTTWGTPTNRKKGTISFWVKRSEIGSSSGRYLVYSYNGSANNSFGIYFVSDDTLEFQFGGSSAKNIRTNAVFRDPSAWYHVVFAWDTTDATPANRTKIYVNNVEQALGTTNYPSQNDDAQFPATTDNYIGYTSSITLGGYLTESYFIDGSAKTPSDFGETDTDTGVWKPKAYSGSYGTNGFYLKFADNSGTTSTTLGKDSSGNGNNWTPNNFSVTAGVGNDSLVDTPTPYGTDTGAGGEVRGNYATLNPLNNGGLTLTNGNLDSSQTNVNAYYSCKSTIGMSSGKWYWEVLITNRSEQSNSRFGIGMSNASELGNQFVGETSGGYSYFTDSASLTDGYIVNVSFTKITGAGFTTNDVLMFAYDADNGKIWFGKNGTWLQSGVPASGTNPQFSSIPANTYFPAISNYSAGGATAAASQNFGQRPFAYTAPSGFKALCTQNLPTPTIGATATTRADDYFNAVLYTGTGSSLGVTGVGFQPDWVWIKERSGVADHGLYDAVRGVQKQLESNTTTAETTETTGLTAFNSDGFTVGALAQLNTNTDTYVAWNWKANGTGSSNTAGSISSTVSANTTAGFSIVTYTGTGANATVGHGLGVAPSMIIVKRRDAATSWRVYHTSIGNTGALYLNLTDTTETNSVFWNNTSPTSSVFTVGTDAGVNASSNTFVAYCFAPVAGYSAFGSYTGNGSTDGPFIYTGFRPKWILIRPPSINDSWQLEDAVRSPFNTVNDQLFAHNSNAEQVDSATRNTDFLSNGFKIRGTNGGINQSSATYIYAAFAENPFKYSLAR